MRKVTASAVILTALTGCSQSNVPNAQWNFEVPENTDTSAQTSTQTSTQTSAQTSAQTDSVFTDSVFTDDALAQRYDPKLPASAQKMGFVGNPTSGKMGPAFEQPWLDSESSGIATLGLASQNLSKLNENVTTGNVVTDLISPKTGAQTEGYIRPALRSPLPSPTVTSYGSPFARSPFSAQAYIPAAPTYSASTYSASTYSAPTYSAPTYSAPTYSAEPASSELPDPVPFTASLPQASPQLISEQPETSSFLALPPVAPNGTASAVQLETNSSPGTQISPGTQVAVAPFGTAASLELTDVEGDTVAIAQPTEITPRETTLIEAVPAEEASTEIKLARLLQTLPQRSEPAEAISEQIEATSEPAILSIIRADQQARQATQQTMPALVAEQMPTLTTPDLATVEPVVDMDNTATVSPLLQELQSANSSAPLQAVYVPIPETSATDMSATFILGALTALSEEANTAPLSVLSTAQPASTSAQAPLLERTVDAPELNTLLQSVTPAATLVGLEPTPTTESTLTDVQVTSATKASIDMSIEPAKVMEAYRKGAYSALDANRLQSDSYRPKNVWQ